MRKVFFMLCMLSQTIIHAQDFSYNSAENPFYWKNRKPYAGYWQQDVHYKISAQLNDSTDAVTATEILLYTNNSQDTLREAYFHVYQNAFIKGGYLEQLNRANGFYQQFGKYEAAGKGTEVRRFQVNGKPAVLETDFSVIKVILPEPILPGAIVTFSMDFTTWFDDGGNQRRRMKMFRDAAGNKQYDGVHWYPRICVYDRKFGWETAQHLGKEFYGDFGTFEVDFTLPSQYVMEATGELQNEAEVLPAELRSKLDIKNFAKKPWDEKASDITPRGGFKTWKFRSVNTHDFAWTCDPTYRIGEVELPMKGNPRGKVRCIAVVQEPHASGWQDAAFFTSKVIALYSRDFGVYAYPKMVCADARDGMEYPMLTLDGGSSPGYYGLIAHEVGHNWFFGMVGNNETYRASLDEGFTQFLTHWSTSRLLQSGLKAGKKGWAGKYYQPMPSLDQTVYQGYLRDAMNNADMPLNTHSDDFNGALNHGGGYGHVYYKTATMLYNLQYVLGDSLFLAAMQHYFKQWEMAHPYFEDFRNSIIQYTHTDLNWFFDQWLETTKHIDYGIKKVKFKNQQLSITLERKGEMQMPVDLRIQTSDTTQLDFTIPNTWFAKKDFGIAAPKWTGWGSLNPTYTLQVPMVSKPKQVSIDPSYRLADINELNNHWKCETRFTFDHQINNPPDRHHYILKARPELWYNSYDGLKAGIHLNGNYMNWKHVFKATIWYNTAVGTNYDEALYQKSSERYPVHYAFSYKTRLARDLDIQVQSRMLDGLFVNKLAFEKTEGKNLFRVYAKTMRRVQLYYLPAYQFTDMNWSSFLPNLSSYDEWNNVMALEWERGLNYGGGYARLLAGLRNSFLWSDFNYTSIYLQVTQSHPISKFELRSRLFMQYIGGSRIAPESQLYLAGANPEEMADNKFNRAPGLVPAQWFRMGDVPNLYQAGGGLNIRGYAGYVAPVETEKGQVFVYRGNAGAAVNLELDYDKFIPLRAGKLSSYFHIDAYLFLDAGILSTKAAASPEYTVQPIDKSYHTNLMASGGHGLALTLKKWGKLDEIKPLTLRFDIPFYLSQSPYEQGNNLMFRYVLGISRSF